MCTRVFPVPCFLLDRFIPLRCFPGSYPLFVLFSPGFPLLLPVHYNKRGVQHRWAGKQYFAFLTHLPS